MARPDRWMAAALALCVTGACERSGGGGTAAVAPTATAAPLATPAPVETAAASQVPTGAPATPSSPQTPPPGEPPAPAPTPAPSPAAPPPAPSPVAAILREVVALEPGAPPLPLRADSRTTVDPAATFRVELSAPVPDARLLLLDASDALVAAEGARELGATTRLTLAPAVPLVPGSRYTLRLDGAVTRDLHAADGRVFAPVGHPLLAAGTPPPKEPKPAPKKKRARR